MSDLADEMMRVFRLPTGYWSCPVMFMAGHLCLDPAMLEKALERRHGKVRDGESLNDYVARHYGVGAAKLVTRAINGEAIRQ